MVPVAYAQPRGISKGYIAVQLQLIVISVRSTVIEFSTIPGERQSGSLINERGNQSLVWLVSIVLRENAAIIHMQLLSIIYNL